MYRCILSIWCVMIVFNHSSSLEIQKFSVQISNIIYSDSWYVRQNRMKSIWHNRMSLLQKVMNRKGKFVLPLNISIWRREEDVMSYWNFICMRSIMRFCLITTLTVVKDIKSCRHSKSIRPLACCLYSQELSILSRNAIISLPAISFSNILWKYLIVLYNTKLFCWLL